MADAPQTLIPAAPGHAPPAFFSAPDGELRIGGLRLSTLVARVGQTPFYAYSRSAMQQRLDALRQALPAGVRLHYAVKANPMPALVGFMSARADGLDVASGGELKTALDAGMPAQAISLAGPGKRDVELRQAVAAGVLVNLESLREVEVLAQASRGLGLAARVAVRVNPDFELKSAGMRMGGGARPFGVDAEQVPALLDAVARAGLQWEGFHFYPGSQCLDGQAIAEALRHSYALAMRLIRLAGAARQAVRLLNLGGGLGVPYFPGERPLDLQPVAQALAELQAQARTELPQAALALELGRYLVAEAGVYVCRVTDRKLSRGKVFLVVDGGLHHHLAATGNFGQVLRKNYPVAIGNRMAEAPAELCSVVGPSCTPLDRLADRVMLPAAQVGDWLVVFQSGAYGASASPHRFLSHPACLEVLV